MVWDSNILHHFFCESMNTHCFRTLIFLFVGTLLWPMANAQPDSFRYYDARNFSIDNQGFDTATLANPYTRMPLDIYKRIPKQRSMILTDLNCSAGIAIRFRTNSKNIAVRYRLMYNASMSHMPATGVKGVDLYRALINEKKRPAFNYIGSNYPKDDTLQNSVLMRNGDGQMAEYILNLPLYDGVKELYLGVDSAAEIHPVTDVLHRARVVFYGTSIMQGGCASRPGVLPSSIFARQLGIECINLGVSGEAKLDWFMADAISRIRDIDVLILDPLPNCTARILRDSTHGFIDRILKTHPKLRIIMVGQATPARAEYDQVESARSTELNSLWHNSCKIYQEKYPNQFFYVEQSAEAYAKLGITDFAPEATVDGIHYTDAGFLAYYRLLTPTLVRVLNELIDNDKNL